MSLEQGTRLGPYEIVAPIGAGGMGEVYRAHDTRLDRDVAIKLSVQQFSERFEREARTISSLNHPHVCSLYDIGPNYLVMELVDGTSLHGPLPVNDALAAARQIAQALEAAHEKGIVHRDLKPDNIKIKPDGTVKVLDFGIAKMASDNAPNELSAPGALTQVGVPVGTPAYMSPEQARGMDVDKRADIWAFGAILYELLTGERLFKGDSTTDILAAVVGSEPNWSNLPRATPEPIRRLLKRCLKKDARLRLPDIGVARLEIDDALSGDAATAAEQRPPRVRSAVPLAAAILIGAGIVGSVWWLGRSPATPMHLSVALAPGAFGTNWVGDPFAISPQGEWLVYVVEREGTRHLYLQRLSERGGRIIEGSDDARPPFFSPDGNWIAFGSGNTLKKVPVSGGAPVHLADIEEDAFAGGSWSEDGTITFVPQFNSGLWTVSEDGGTPELLLETDLDRDRIAYIFPHVLPEGRGVLFSMMTSRARSADDFSIAVLESGASEPRVLIPGGTHARYVPAKKSLVYIQGGTLLSVPFDLSRLEVTGTPQPALDGLYTGIWGLSFYALSQNGTLVYEPESVVQGNTQLAIVDRSGVRPISDGRTYPWEFSVSPDGRQVVARTIAANDELWIYDIERGTSLPLTAQPPDEIFPVWTPDGSRIAFGTWAGTIFWTRADGTGDREEITSGDYGRYPGSFSADGKTLAFVETHPSTRRDIWLIPLDGERTAKPFLTTDADEWSPQFSPDGEWLAYASDETGRAEIYLRRVDGTGGRRQISRQGGNWPRWASNWELFFSTGDEVWSALIDAETGEAGPAALKLESPTFNDVGVNVDSSAPRFFDLLPDREGLVINFWPEYPSPTHFNVVLNWFEQPNAE